MVPVNAAVAVVSARLSDRTMVTGALLLCTACLLALTAAAASPLAFFGGGVLLFVGTVVLEGTATSLMSKVIWRGFAQGVLNAGEAHGRQCDTCTMLDTCGALDTCTTLDTCATPDTCGMLDTCSALYCTLPAVSPGAIASCFGVAKCATCYLCVHHPSGLSIRMPPAGLLSTEAGTLGRFAGNGLLAVVGRLTGLEDAAQLAHFAHLLHLILAAVCAALLAHLACNFRRIQG